jgi:hypothetical protein
MSSVESAEREDHDECEAGKLGVEAGLLESDFTSWVRASASGTAGLTVSGASVE